MCISLCAALLIKIKVVTFVSVIHFKHTTYTIKSKAKFYGLCTSNRIRRQERFNQTRPQEGCGNANSVEHRSTREQLSLFFLTSTPSLSLAPF